MVDRLIKMVHYVLVTKNMLALDLFKVLDREVFRLHSLLNFIVSDRNLLIMWGYWKALMQYMTIDRKISMAFHPQTDNQTEQQNSTLEQYLWAFINFQQDNWVQWLRKAKFAYNNTIHSSTKMTLFFALLGYHPRMSYKHNINKCSASKSANSNIARYRETLAFLKKKLAIA